MRKKREICWAVTFPVMLRDVFCARLRLGSVSRGGIYGYGLWMFVLEIGRGEGADWLPLAGRLHHRQWDGAAEVNSLTGSGLDEVCVCVCERD